MQTKVDSEQKVHLQTVHFRYQNTTNLGVVSVVVVCIVKELGSEENCRDDGTMHVQFRQQKVIALNESINVNQSQNVALIRTGRVLVDSEEEE